MILTSPSGHIIWFASLSHWLAVTAFQTWLTPLNISPQGDIHAGFPNLEFNFCICSDSKWWILHSNASVWSSLFLAADYIWINQVIVIMQHAILQPLKLRQYMKINWGICWGNLKKYKYTNKWKATVEFQAEHFMFCNKGNISFAAISSGWGEA